MDKPKYFDDADKLFSSLPNLPPPVEKPVLVLLCGLPGTGKTYFAQKLIKRVPAVILESDSLRRILTSIPDYSQSESTRLFSAIHFLSQKLLKTGHSVIIDATNLIEKQRRHFYDIAASARAKLVIVRIDAPVGIVQNRLKKRKEMSVSRSDADWGVYLEMAESFDKIKRKHYSVDTSVDYTEIQS
ncbi:MAG: ATP-binding protein [Dehalococcoidales bacterium]